MDIERIDDLARNLLIAAPRRAVLAGLTSGLLAVLPSFFADDVEGKKKHGKRKKKRKNQNSSTSPPPPPRQPLTLTFANPNPIAIPGLGDRGIANPYLSPIQVSGFTNGVITDVNVLLNNVNHTFPPDIDVLLAASHLPDRNALIMSDVGGGVDAINVNLVLDDQAPTAGPSIGVIPSGTYLTTNIVGSPDTFPAPAPAPTGNSLLSTFHGQNPNGTWQLFVVDNGVGDTGNIAGGWAIQITAEVDV